MQEYSKDMPSENMIDTSVLEAVSPDEIEVTVHDRTLELTVCSLSDHTPLKRIEFTLDPGKVFPEQKFSDFFQYFSERVHHLMLSARDNPQASMPGLSFEIGNLVRQGLESAGLEGDANVFQISSDRLSDDEKSWMNLPEEEMKK